MNPTIDMLGLESDLRRFTPHFQAYMECSDELQQHARRLFTVLADPDTCEDEINLTAMALVDILYPHLRSAIVDDDSTP